MASFLHLPNELVSEIAGQVMPEDIENFSLTSHNVYAVALPLLEEHRELKKRYRAFANLEKAEFDGNRLGMSEFSDNSTSNFALGDSISTLLTEVLADQRVAPYIKELRLDGWFSEWESMVPDPSNERHEHIPYTQEQTTLFKQTLSIYVLPSKLEEWIEVLESGAEDPIIGLLLILLPDLNSIKFEQRSNIAYDLQQMVQRIKTDCIPGIPILSHLERVNLQYDDYFGEVNRSQTDLTCPIHYLAFLATLPSLKSLYGQHIGTYGRPHDFSCLLPRSSNITDLGFKLCNLSLEQMGDLLQGLKALRTFHYISDTYYGENGQEIEPWNPAGMCKLLSKYAQQSLEVLDLRSKQKPVGPIQDLRNFAVLKELTLSFSTFQVPGLGHWQILTSQLPVSIKKLVLHGLGSEKIPLLDLMRLIQEVVHFKPERFPSLEKLCLCSTLNLAGIIQVADKMREMCGGVGIEIWFTQEK